MTQHTATPWKINSDFICKMTIDGNKISSNICNVIPDRISRKEAEANAAFIIRACNSYDDMLEALKEVELHSRKRLPIKKATWLKIRSIISNVGGIDENTNMGN